jgi:hypothetical protein
MKMLITWVDIYIILGYIASYWCIMVLKGRQDPLDTHKYIPITIRYFFTQLLTSFIIISIWPVIFIILLIQEKRNHI